MQVTIGPDGFLATAEATDYLILTERICLARTPEKSEHSRDNRSSRESRIICPRTGIPARPA